MSDLVIVALITGASPILIALIHRAGQKTLIAKADKQLVETQKVHVLVNDHATRQDEIIQELREEVLMLRTYIAKEDT